MEKMKKNLRFLTWNYNLLTFGNMTSKLGSKVYNVVLMYWLVDITNSSIYIGYITAASILPIIFINLIGGALVDKYNKKKILVICDLISSIACMIISFIAYKNIVNPSIIILTSFIIGSCDALFIPTVKSILPEIVESNDIEKCNSLTSIINQFMRVMGPLIAGILLNNLALGVSICFFINGISYLISSISESLIKYKFVLNNQKLKKHVFLEIGEGYNYIIKNKWLCTLILVSCLMNMFLASYNILLPLYYKSYFNNGATIYSQALSLEAIGGIIAGISFITNKTKLNYFGKIKFYIIISGFALGIVQFIQIKYISLFGALLLGYALTKFNILSVTIIQNNTESEFLGRVFSFHTLAALSVMPLANIAFGYISNNLLNYIFLVCGVGIIFISMIIKKVS